VASAFTEAAPWIVRLLNIQPGAMMLTSIDAVWVTSNLLLVRVAQEGKVSKF
jgi:hypothetical protein